MVAILDEAADVASAKEVSLDEVMNVFKGSDDAKEIMDRILLRRMETLRGYLIHALSIRDDPVNVSKFLTLYEELPPVNKARLLISSEFAELVLLSRGDADEMGERLKSVSDDAWFALAIDCVKRERLFVDPGLSLSVDIPKHAVWSPLGDWSAMPEGNSYKVDSGYRIGDIIALDFDSPVAQRRELRSGVLSQPRIAMSDDEKQIVCEKYNAALAIIDRQVPTYGALIRNFTRRVIVRKSFNEFDEVQSHFGSEHVPRQPGSIRVLNPHRSEHLLITCVEQLLHESTHNFLAAWEVGHRKFFTYFNQYRPISPWSGNAIPNSSLAHAMFIYYACHDLFSKYLAGNPDLNKDEMLQAKKRHNVFGAGFLINRELSDLFVTNDPAYEELNIVINAMQRDIKSFYQQSVQGVAA